MTACLILAILPCSCESHDSSIRTANLAAGGDLGEHFHMTSIEGGKEVPKNKICLRLRDCYMKKFAEVIYVYCPLRILISGSRARGVGSQASPGVKSAKSG